MKYRFFFFFLDFFFSRRGDGEGLSELLTKGANKFSDFSFTVRSFSALMFIYSPVSVLVFLFLLPAALLGQRIWIVWIFHQPERVKVTEFESWAEITLSDEYTYISMFSKATSDHVWLFTSGCWQSHVGKCSTECLCQPRNVKLTNFPRNHRRGTLKYRVWLHLRSETFHSVVRF